MTNSEIKPETRNPKMKNLFKIIIAALFALFIFGLGIGVGYGLTHYLNNQKPAAAAETPPDFNLFWEVWNIVEDKFYDGVPRNSKITTYGAIKGALAALDDPYTIFVEPKPRELERDALNGQFGGIGAYIRRLEENGENRVVLEPMVDSPAEKAGMQKDDVLLQVDDTPIQPEMTTDEIVLLIRGDVGTEVTLTVSRNGNPVTLIIERAIIETPSVTWRILEENPDIGYIKIHLFSNRTGNELERAITELSELGAKKYILDLRGNGGGLLEAAIDVSSAFLDDGIVLKEDRRGEEPQTYKVRRRDRKLLTQPLAVLVDGGSASASEITAGALQDHHRAPLIGERTYGKGSVQLVYDLSDQSSVHVTVAKWFTPQGHSIDGVGLTPDIKVLFTEEDHQQNRDPQFQRALEYLQNLE